MSAAAYTTGWLAAHLGGVLRGAAEPVVSGVNSLDDAGSGEITFIADAAHLRRWPESRAVAAVVAERLEPPAFADERPIIVVPDAEMATIRLLELFGSAPPMPEPGIHPTAWVHESARVASDARIGPQVTVDRGAVIGSMAVLHAGVRVYAGVEIGGGSVIHGNCVIRERCRIGRGVVMHPGVVIGADGFGYRADPEGGGLLRVPHAGTVIIEDAVEIGANSCVDRGTFGATVVGTGTKIDNLVQIGHDCRIGRWCVIAGLTGLSGSVTVADGVRMGGSVGVADHVTIGAGARIGARAGVMRDVPAGSTALGCPADDARAMLRQFAAVRKLPGFLRELSRQEAPRR